MQDKIEHINPSLLEKDLFNQIKMGLGCDHLTRSNNVIIDYSIKNGVNFFDTADCYGSNNESEVALGEKLKGYDRSQFFLSTKGGVKFGPTGVVLSGNPEYIEAACNASLKRLQTDYIDLYYLHRVDPETSFEDSVEALKKLIEVGKIKHIGLSEVNADQIRRAYKIYPISAVQIEYAPWSRQDEQNEVTRTCKELGIKIVAYSPLGRALFTSADSSFFTSLEKNDFRNLLPRYSGELLQQNLMAKRPLHDYAAKKCCSLAQLVLAWEIAKGVIPIPSTVNEKHLEENMSALKVNLSYSEVQELDEMISRCHFVGPRYPSAQISAIYPERHKKIELKSDHLNHTKLFAVGALLIGAIGLFSYLCRQKGNEFSPVPSQKFF